MLWHVIIWKLNVHVHKQSLKVPQRGHVMKSPPHLRSRGTGWGDGATKDTQNLGPGTKGTKGSGKVGRKNALETTLTQRQSLLCQDRVWCFAGESGQGGRKRELFPTTWCLQSGAVIPPWGPGGACCARTEFGVLQGTQGREGGRENCFPPPGACSQGQWARPEVLGPSAMLGLYPCWNSRGPCPSCLVFQRRFLPECQSDTVLKHRIEVKTEECLLWAPSQISLNPTDHQKRETLFMSAGIDELQNIT